jgi:hypothetical protein
MFPLFKNTQETNNGYDSFEQEALRGNTTSTALSDLYFSQKNVDALQEGIRYMVYVKSGEKHIIDKQSDTDLKIVMRSVFLEYGRNLPFDIVGQVRDLNAKVLDFCVNRILEEINMYIHYRVDISTNYVPLPRSENTSSAGTKTLIMKEF